MPKKLKIKPEIVPVPEPTNVPMPVNTVKKINPITQEFGNGDLNILRDKINEIIAQ